MVEIDRVKKGHILITEEFMFGQLRQVYGPVVLIDYERKILGIKVGGETRSFPPEKLWTIPAFIDRKNGGGQRRFSPVRETRVLAGFIRTILNGEGPKNDIDGILKEIESKGIEPTRAQDALEVLINL